MLPAGVPAAAAAPGVLGEYQPRKVNTEAVFEMTTACTDAVVTTWPAHWLTDHAGAPESVSVVAVGGVPFDDVPAYPAGTSPPRAFASRSMPVLTLVTVSPL